MSRSWKGDSLQSGFGTSKELCRCGKRTRKQGPDTFHGILRQYLGFEARQRSGHWGKHSTGCQLGGQKCLCKGWPDQACQNSTVQWNLQDRRVWDFEGNTMAPSWRGTRSIPAGSKPSPRITWIQRAALVLSCERCVKTIPWPCTGRVYPSPQRTIQVIHTISSGAHSPDNI